MDGGADRADLFAAGVLAVLAGHGLEVRFRRVEVALVIGVDAEPLHVAADFYLVAADDGDVVFCVAADDAGVAADAGVLVDRHRPRIFRAVLGVDVVVPRIEERVFLVRNLAHDASLLREVRGLFVLVDGGPADDGAVFGLIAFEGEVAITHAAGALGTVVSVVTLGDAEIVGVAGLAHGRACSVEQISGSADWVRVEADTGAGASATLAAVAEVDDDGVVGAAG